MNETFHFHHFRSPEETETLFNHLYKMGLYRFDGVLRGYYWYPQRWFSGECRVIVCHGDDRIIGVLVVAKDGFVRPWIKGRFGKTHYGFAMLYVLRQFRRQGIAKEMMKLLVAFDDSKYVVMDHVLRHTMPIEAIERGIGIYSICKDSPILWPKTVIEDRASQQRHQTEMAL